jgi:hypothetical protein
MTHNGKKPWIDGIIDSLVGAKLLLDSSIPHRNRLAVILLDSALETSCRAFLEHEKDVKLDSSHRGRSNLMKASQANLPGIDDEVWKSIDYYYHGVRCDFYHQSASKTLTENALMDYLETVYFIIDRAFSIDTEARVAAEYQKLKNKEAADVPPPAALNWSKITGRTERILVGVSVVNPRNVEDLNGFFRKEGVPLRLKANEFTGILARNSGTKNLFYFNRDLKRWELTAAGRFKAGNFLN